MASSMSTSNSAGTKITGRTLALGFLCGVAVGLIIFRTLAYQDDTLRSLHEAKNQLTANYISNLGDDQLEHAAIDGMMVHLDDYSERLSAKAYKQLLESAQGHFAGVGLEIEKIKKRFTVIRILPNSPAAESSIAAGDEILAIDGAPVTGWLLSDLVGALRGLDGEPVRIKLLRPNLANNTDRPAAELEVTLTRSVLTSVYLDWRALDENVAYLRVLQCYDGLAHDISDAIEQLQPLGLILDLRSNPGGTLSSAVATVDLFIDRGVIVSTVSGRGQTTFEANAQTPYRNLPLAILVDAGTASAAEIIAGALQDHQRAKVLGSQTFAKGSVQTLMPPLSNGSVLKITTAHYQTPNGRSFVHEGLLPDYDFGHSEEEAILAAAVETLALPATSAWGPEP